MHFSSIRSCTNNLEPIVSLASKIAVLHLHPHVSTYLIQFSSYAQFLFDEGFHHVLGF